MPKDRNLLFVIADGERARFVRPAEDNTLHSDATLDPLPAPARSADLGPDHPGASCHTEPYARHAPRHDLYALEKSKFGRAVASWLNAGAADDSFEELVIVAPPRTLIAIRQRLNAATNAKVVGTLPKDLANTPDGELWPHLRWWICPARHDGVISHRPRG